MLNVWVCVCARATKHSIVDDSLSAQHAVKLSVSSCRSSCLQEMCVFERLLVLSKSLEASWSIKRSIISSYWLSILRSSDTLSSLCAVTRSFSSLRIGSIIIEKVISCWPWKRERREKNTVQRPERANSSLEVLSPIISFKVANKLNRILSVISLSLSLSLSARCLSRQSNSRMHVESTMSNLVTGCLRVTLCRMNSAEKSFYSFSHFVFASMESRTDKIFIRSCSCDVVFHEEKQKLMKQVQSSWSILMANVAHTSSVNRHECFHRERSLGILLHSSVIRFRLVFLLAHDTDLHWQRNQIIRSSWWTWLRADQWCQGRRPRRRRRRRQGEKKSFLASS